MKGKGVNERNIRFDRDYQVEKPWPNFWADSRLAVEQILVPHKKNNRILNTVKKQLYDYNGKPRYDKKSGRKLFGKGIAARGALHEESVYGKHKHGGKEYFHIRKPIDFIQNHKHVAKIVDKGVREAVEKRFLSLGLDIYNSKGYKLTDLPTDRRKEIFFKVGNNGENIPQIYLPNKNGDPVPVRKVRIREKIGNAEQLKEGFNQYVNPKNNHHVLVYLNYNDELDEEVVTFWVMVERKKQGMPLYQLPGNGKAIITTLHENDMFILGLSNEEFENKKSNYRFLSDHIYRVQKISSLYYDFRKHIASTINKKNEHINVQSFQAWKRLNPIKIDIDCIGNLKGQKFK